MQKPAEQVSGSAATLQTLVAVRTYPRSPFNLGEQLIADDSGAHVLGDKIEPRKMVPTPKERYLQQGDLTLREIEEMPEDGEPIELARLADGGVHLGNGHVLYSADKP